MKYFDRVKNAELKENPVILGIETSCDDTAAAVIRGREILSSEIFSSAGRHVEFGGVVPEIASRCHTDDIDRAVSAALSGAGVDFGGTDAVAVTYGAGLIGALLVGVSYAKALAFAMNKPLIAVNHIRGHIAAAYLQDTQLEPPFICLLASGGHTAVIHVKDYLNLEILGQTTDDAAGEAFDKVARVLKLPYPGGPSIERLAKEGKDTVTLPRMLAGDKNTFNFSYSGLKTAVLNYVNNTAARGDSVSFADVAHSFQRAATEVLVERALRACDLTGLKTLTLGGGVAANGYLREGLLSECKKKGIRLVLPEKKYCTDNAAMIAMEGALQYRNKNFADLSLNAKASLPL